MFKNTFASGEIQPDLYARADIAQFQSGCALGLNFRADITGALKRRPGFPFKGLTKTQALVSRCIAYVRSRYDANMVELGNGYTRIWYPDGTPVLTGGVPYEVSGSPYIAADLADLRWTLVGNCLVFFHMDGRAPQRLQKVSDNSWNWQVYEFTDGPWQAENTDVSKTISAPDWRQGNVVTITANFNLFDPSMDSTTYIRLRAASSVPGLRTWAADEQPKGQALRYSNGRFYYKSDGASTLKTGNTAPSHDIGTVNDGMLNWTYIHDNSGMVQILNVISATQASVRIIHNLPTTGQWNSTDSEWEFPSDPTTHALAFPSTFAWSMCEYSNYYGWPNAWPCLKGERLIVGGGANSPDKYNGCQTAGYYPNSANFSPGLGTGLVLDDDAIQGYCGDQSFQPEWFLSQSLLICGTHGGEGAIVGQTSEQPLTPSTSTPKPISSNGSSGARPKQVQDTICYVVRGGRTLRNLTVSPYDFPGTSEDLSFIANHIANRGFVEIDYVTAPDYTLWARMADNSVAAFTYNREQNFKAWTQQQLGGGMSVESLCVVPDSAGIDRLWVIGSRIKNGAAQRLIMRLSFADDLIRLDASVRYQGAATSSVSGLSHLEGEAVLMMCGQGNGKYIQCSTTVSGGVANLPAGLTGTDIIVGLSYLSRWESLPLTANNSQGKLQRNVDCNAAVSAVDFRVGAINYGEDADVQDYQNDRAYGDSQGMAPQHFVARMNVPGDHDADPRLFIECDSGFDFTIKSINATMSGGN